MRTKPKKVAESKSLETKIQNELIQPELIQTMDNGPHSLSASKTMDDGHHSSNVPKTTVDDEHNSSMVLQTTDNRLHSSSVPSDSGHYKDATLVDDALLRRDRKRVKRDGTATSWSSEAVEKN